MKYSSCLLKCLNVYVLYKIGPGTTNRMSMCYRLPLSLIDCHMLLHYHVTVTCIFAGIIIIILSFDRL